MQCYLNKHDYPVSDEVQHHVVERSSVHINVIQQLPQRHTLVTIIAIFSDGGSDGQPLLGQIVSITREEDSETEEAYLDIV